MSKTSELIPKKRGRPRKNPLPEHPTQAELPVKRRRGRPPKAKKAIKKRSRKQVKKAPKKAVQAPARQEFKPAHNFGDTCVVAKLFLNNKVVSKQLPWVEGWTRKYHEAVSFKDYTGILALVDELSSNTNKFLKERGWGVEMFLHIPKYKLMEDEKVIDVLFDPAHRGAECRIYYKSGTVPLGMSSSLKSTTVANKFTEAVKSFIPIGACA